MSLKLTKLDVVVLVFAGLEVYLRRLCVMMDVVATSLMAGTRIGKERKRKRARRAGIPQVTNRFTILELTILKAR